MKFIVVYKPDCQATQDLIEEKCKSLNDDFRKDYAVFLNLYNKIPEVVRKKLPWNDIMEFRAKAIIIDSYEIKLAGGYDGEPCYELTFNFNETTLEAFATIAPMLEKLTGISLKGLTKKALRRKVRKDLEKGGNVKILNYGEGGN